MNIWFLADPGRLDRERAAIAQLEESSGWLVGATWSLNTALCVDAVIRAHDAEYHVRMIYPPFFPSVPPIVRPLNAQEHWSSHQYGGADGSLCLEWRSDNWHSEVTGAQMLESAFRLLHTENPRGAESPDVTMAVPSDHQLSVGQEVRGRRMRFYVGRDLGTFLEQLPSDTSGILMFSLLFREHTWLTLIHDVQSADETVIWRDNTIPAFMRGREGASLRRGVLFKTELDPETVSGVNGFNSLKEMLCRTGCRLDILDKHYGGESGGVRLGQGLLGILILDKAHNPHFFIVFDNG